LSALLSALCDAGYRVSLETSGALAIEPVTQSRPCRRCKDSRIREESRNLYEQLAQLRETDLVKFVICSRADYEWSCSKVTELGLSTRCAVLFSPSASELPARELAEWVLADRLPVRFQLQLHKSSGATNLVASHPIPILGA